MTKGYFIVRTNFETRDTALKWVQELAKGRSKSGKSRFVPPQLTHIKRSGPDYRSGMDIKGQHYKVRIHFSDTATETINDKILRLIQRETLAGGAVPMDVPQTSQPPEGSSL